MDEETSFPEYSVLIDRYNKLLKVAKVVAATWADWYDDDSWCEEEHEALRKVLRELGEY